MSQEALKPELGWLEVFAQSFISFE